MYIQHIPWEFDEVLTLLEAEADDENSVEIVYKSNISFIIKTWTCSWLRKAMDLQRQKLI